MHVDKHVFWTNIFGREIFQSLLEVIKTNCFTPLNQVHSLSIRILSPMQFSPDHADNQKRFLTNLLGGEIFQGFLQIIKTNRFESSNRVQLLPVGIMSSIWFSHAEHQQKHFSNWSVWGTDISRLPRELSNKPYWVFKPSSFPVCPDSNSEFAMISLCTPG